MMAASPSYGQFYGVIYQPGSPPQPTAMHPSATAAREGIPNTPSSKAEGNLHVLRLVLAQLPVAYNLNSAYRSPAVNKAVGGAGGYCSRIPGDPHYSASCSYHTTGLAADVTPVGWSNEKLASWLYENRRRFPNLDQVIWYTDTTHVHIGLDPVRARAYHDAPGGFYVAKKEGSDYTAWKPGDVVRTLATGIATGSMFLLYLGAAVAVAAWLAKK